jgi:chromosome segregation ATPase
LAKALADQEEMRGLLRLVAAEKEGLEREVKEVKEGMRRVEEMEREAGVVAESIRRDGVRLREEVRAVSNEKEMWEGRAFKAEKRVEDIEARRGIEVIEVERLRGLLAEQEDAKRKDKEEQDELRDKMSELEAQKSNLERRLDDERAYREEVEREMGEQRTERANLESTNREVSADPDHDPQSLAESAAQMRAPSSPDRPTLEKPATRRKFAGRTGFTAGGAGAAARRVGFQGSRDCESPKTEGGAQGGSGDVKHRAGLEAAGARVGTF